MIHHWPPPRPRPPPQAGPDQMFVVFYVLICVVVVSQVFYVIYIKYSYKNFKRIILQKGRLLQIVPVVTVSTVTSSQGCVPYVHHVNFQPTTGSNIYIAPDGSRIIDNKVAPPAYTA